MKAFNLSAALIICLIAVTFSQDGPSAWPKNFPMCNGKSNSPVNLRTTKRRQAQRWKLTGWDKPSKYKVLDEEYAIKWELNEGQRIIVSGGGLTDTYDLVQFHIHWGSDNSRGSEHTLDYRRFPMEIHFVHKRRDFDTATAAVESEDRDAIAVLGLFFKIQKRDNPNLEQFIQAVRQVRASGDQKEIENFRIDALLNLVRSEVQKDFFRYFGGLTTPSCNEVVQWTVFTEPIGISAYQMNVIRLGNPDAVGGEFFRPLQKLNGRTPIRFIPSKGSTNVKLCGDVAQNYCKSLRSVKGKTRESPRRPTRPKLWFFPSIIRRIMIK